MMEYDDQLRLQAYLDGELPESEARRFGEQLERDPEAAALLEELRRTGECLAGFEEGVKLPETREFYWSKIQREIQRREADAAPAASAEASGLAWLRRWLLPATGVAFVALIGLLALRGTRAASPGVVEVTQSDSGAFTYHDYSAGATLVWLSFPAEGEIGEPEDLTTLE